MKHAKTPWTCRQAPGTDQELWIDSTNGDEELGHYEWNMLGAVYGCDERLNIGSEKVKASAEFIVKAVNNHDRLVEALRIAVEKTRINSNGWVQDADALLSEIERTK